MADTQPTRTTNFELRDYFRIVWTRKWTAFIVLVLVAAGIMFLSYRQTPIYQSQVKVVTPTAPQTQNSQGVPIVQRIDPEVEAQIAISEIVSKRVQQSLSWAHDVNPDQLARFVTVAPLKNAGSILLFQAQHPNPQRAADLAQAFATEYLNYRNEATAAPFTAAIKKYKEQLKNDQDALDNFNALHPFKVTEPKVITSQRNDLTTAVQLDTGYITQNQQALDQVTADAQNQVLQPAKVAHRPVRPDHLRDAIFAVIIGLAIGIAAAFLRDYADDSLRGPDDLERQAGAPLLGVIPHVSSRSTGIKGKRDAQYLVSVADPKAPATESYRTMRTNLLFVAVGGPIRRLLIGSPVKGEGKSTTAANLATVMALAGQRVLLVGADLRRPSIHKFFGLSNRVGLSSVLSGQATLMEAIQDPGVKGLRVMAGGPVPPNPAELLGSVAMKQFLEQAADAADWVILDGPPVLGLADASVLATLSDGVLLVVNEATNRRVLAHARDQLGKVRSKVVGAVLNNFGPATSYYYYADYYAYTSAYYYEAEPEEKGRRRRKDKKAVKDAAKTDRKRRRKPETNGHTSEGDVDLETETVEVASGNASGFEAVATKPPVVATSPPAVAGGTVVVEQGNGSGPAPESTNGSGPAAGDEDSESEPSTTSFK
ncbi:MAG TPA: polysaccharide biosynthesis tyrosine autokinase [Actinomycetota bacterium]|nr:polysaccharide biosynthesis tyrosine autokinase [Actinomycetota bacterium]